MKLLVEKRVWPPFLRGAAPLFFEEEVDCALPMNLFDVKINHSGEIFPEKKLAICNLVHPCMYLAWGLRRRFFQTTRFFHIVTSCGVRIHSLFEKQSKKEFNFDHIYKCIGTTYTNLWDNKANVQRHLGFCAISSGRRHSSYVDEYERYVDKYERITLR